MLTASITFFDSSSDVKREVMYSIEPIEAFNGLPPSNPGYNKHNHCRISSNSYFFYAFIKIHNSKVMSGVCKRHQLAQSNLHRFVSSVKKDFLLSID